MLEGPLRDRIYSSWMKARTESDNWVQSLRTLIRDSMGANWQIKPNKGKTKIRIRFDDGTRVEKMLGIDWSKEEASKTLYKDKVLDASLFLKSINTL